MEQLLKKLIRRLQRPVVNELEMEAGAKFVHNESVSQKMLMQQYRLLASKGREHLPRFLDVGFRKYSQFEEDGILLYIFSLIPPINRTSVEICAGDGRECMTTNLIVNHGWWGHLFDGNDRNVRDGKRFFANHKDTFFSPPRFHHAWITAENVNELIRESGVSGPIDLFSLDIDGMDYWVWKAMTVVQPQVVVCEIHNQIPADKSLTVPYDPKFAFESEDFRSASLAAMVKLGREKGYRLIGTHRFWFNAFFIRDGVGEDVFPEVAPSSCMNDPVSKALQKERWPSTRKFNWQEV
jgi:hypothetical protein